jgi:hypothetical protein
VDADSQGRRRDRRLASSRPGGVLAAPGRDRRRDGDICVRAAALLLLPHRDSGWVDDARVPGRIDWCATGRCRRDHRRKCYRPLVSGPRVAERAPHVARRASGLDCWVFRCGLAVVTMLRARSAAPSSSQSTVGTQTPCAGASTNFSAFLRLERTSDREREDVELGADASSFLPDSPSTLPLSCRTTEPGVSSDNGYRCYSAPRRSADRCVSSRISARSNRVAAARSEPSVQDRARTGAER